MRLLTEREQEITGENVPPMYIWRGEIRSWECYSWWEWPVWGWKVWVVPVWEGILGKMVEFGVFYPEPGQKVRWEDNVFSRRRELQALFRGTVPMKAYRDGYDRGFRDGRKGAAMSDAEFLGHVVASARGKELER